MLTIDSKSVAQATDRDVVTTNTAKVALYKVSVNDYQPDSGIESLVQLISSYKDSQSAKNRTEWIYQKNPSGQPIVCSVEHTASQEKIGLLALCRRQIWTPDGIVNAGILCDMVTDKAHRTLGPAILLLQEAIAAAPQFGLDRVYGWPNDKSIVLIKRFPKAEFGEIDIYRRYFNWTSMFSLKMPRIPALFLGGLVKGLDVAFCNVGQLVLNRFFLIKFHEKFNTEFDELWSRSRVRYNEVGVRDSHFLNWRFGEKSNCAHKIFSLYSRKLRLITHTFVRTLHKQTMTCDRDS